MLSQIRVVPDDALSALELDELRALADAAFGERFDDHDWDHTRGGLRVVATLDGRAVGHAAVVPRPLRIGRYWFDAGYLEAVATLPGQQGQGIGTLVMAEVSLLVRQRHDLGALATGSHAFYERLGWRGWAGPSWVLQSPGDPAPRRTPDEDDGLMVLAGRSPRAVADLTLDIACLARPGDDW